jgi:hypothetical protein
LGSLSADDLLHFQAHPQQFVRRAINRVRAGSPPSDENALEVRAPPRPRSVSYMQS